MESITIPRHELAARLWPDRTSTIDFYFAPDELVVNHGTWSPDHWTGVFLNGLDRVRGSFLGKRIVEVGVGTGIIGTFILLHGPQSYLGTDISLSAIESAQANLGSFSQNDKVELYQGNLLVPVGRNPVDAIIACIPQVPLPDHLRLDQDDNFGNYYNLEEEKEGIGEILSTSIVRNKLPYYDGWGLGLNFLLLAQATSYLLPEGRIILNLGGRPGIDVLRNMFDDIGFTPEILVEEVIEQDPHTDITPLVNDEAARGVSFEFFSDPHGKVKVDAKGANSIKVKGFPVFHKIYVVSGTLPT